MLVGTPKPGILLQVGRLSQVNRAAKNISAKSVHPISLYPTALTSTNDHLTVCFTSLRLYLMQNYAALRH